MRVERRFTVEGESPYVRIPFREATSEIRTNSGALHARANRQTMLASLDCRLPISRCVDP